MLNYVASVARAHAANKGVTIDVLPTVTWRATLTQGKSSRRC